MLVGYMRVSSDGDRRVLDLQRDALLAAGVDAYVWAASDDVSDTRDGFRPLRAVPTPRAWPAEFAVRPPMLQFRAVR